MDIIIKCTTDDSCYFKGRDYICYSPESKNCPHSCSAKRFYKEDFMTNECQQKGIKFDDNKIDWTLLPYQPMLEVIKVLMCGQCKYERDNWQRVPEAKERYKRAIMRHASAYCLDGEMLDSDYSLHHCAHLICCCLFIIWFDIRDKLYNIFTPDYNSIKERYKEQKEKAFNSDIKVTGSNENLKCN